MRVEHTRTDERALGEARTSLSARFCTDGIARLDGATIAVRADPLNLPALFVNVLPFMHVEGDTRAIERAFREMCYRTWGHMELKEEGRLHPFVAQLRVGDGAGRKAP